MQDVSLFISIPSNRDWKGKFGSSLAGLVSHLSLLLSGGRKMENYQLTNFFLRALGQSSCLSIARQSMVDEMLAGNYTHWLSLDDDMTFPMDIVARLLSHGLDIVAINARHKNATPVGSLQGIDGKPLLSFDATGIEEIRTMGGAIFLAKIDTFRNIPKPHFQVIWSPAHNDYVSEDVHFAALLRANGNKLYCDHDTSKLVGHIGDLEYRSDK
jgi:hypothetical protein